MKSWRKKLDRLALPLGVLGLVGVAVYNWRQWQRDKELLAKVGKPDPLPPLEDWPSLPMVSVLVAAWNEADFIERHIESFLALRYPNKELVLCAGGEDGTLTLARRYADEHANGNVNVLKQSPGEGKQRALARSLSQITGSIIFFTDADCLMDNDSFERTLKPIIQHSEAATTGRFAPLSSQRTKFFVLTQWYSDNYGRYHGPHYIEGFIGRNAALTTDVLGQVGRFNDAAPTGTDYYLARQLVENDIRIRYVHNSVIDTQYVTNIEGYLRQQSRWLRNILLHGQRFGAKRQFRNAFGQTLIGAAMVTWPMTFPLTRFVGLVTWLNILAHGVFSRIRYTRFGEITLEQPRRWQVYALAPLFLILDQIMLFYTLIEWIVPNHRWRW